MKSNDLQSMWKEAAINYFKGNAPRICVEGLRKDMKILGYECQTQSRILKPALPGYEARLTNIELRRYVR